MVIICLAFAMASILSGPSGNALAATNASRVWRLNSIAVIKPANTFSAVSPEPGARFNQ